MLPHVRPIRRTTWMPLTFTLLRAWDLAGTTHGEIELHCELRMDAQRSALGIPSIHH